MDAKEIAKQLLNNYWLIASIAKYIFIVIIYLFIISIIRLIYLDIKSMNATKMKNNLPYLKLINRRDSLPFRVEESYVIDGSMTMGRSAKCNVCISDPYLSSSHARFVMKNNKYYVQDIGSKNGTFVNRMPVNANPVPLKNGDQIHLGQLDFLFVDSVR